MGNLIGGFNVCFNVPNIGTLLFHIIFVIAIPTLLVSSNQFNVLKYYLPALVMVASTLTTAGDKDTTYQLFDTLYPEHIPKNDTSAWLSKNFINLLAVMGIMLNGITVAMAGNSAVLGLVTAIIAFMITFPIGGTVIPFFITKMSAMIRSRMVKEFAWPYDWDRYFIGLVFIVLFMTFQVILMRQANNLVMDN